MLVCEVWVFIFGNIIAGTAHNLTQLVAGRLISGIGGAGLLSLCTIALSREFLYSYGSSSSGSSYDGMANWKLDLIYIYSIELTHERQRSTYLNLINAVFIISDSLGPIIGGVLAKSGHWRWM